MNIKQERLGILYIVSGPSGSGKTTLCQRIAKDGLADFAVSATTRAPREGEKDGVAYHFLSQEEFKQKISENAFVEHAEVHGNYYGTLKSEVIGRLRDGIDIVMDIDVQGAEIIRSLSDELLRKCGVDLFVMPPTAEELENRLRNRDTDSEEIIQLRLKNSLEEMSQWDKYTYRLLSSDKESDYQAFKSILLSERNKVSRFI